MLRIVYIYIFFILVYCVLYIGATLRQRKEVLWINLPHSQTFRSSCHISLSCVFFLYLLWCSHSVLTNASCNNLASDKSFGLYDINPLNAELNPICHLLALLGGATIVVVSRLRVKERQLEGITQQTENGKRQAPLSPPSTKPLSVAAV